MGRLQSPQRERAVLLGLVLTGCIQPNSDFPGLSNGQCPDVTQTIQSEFRSSGKKRKVQVVLPDAPQEGMGLIFGFHGLNPASADPITKTTADNDMARHANERNLMFLVPEALPTSLALLGDFLLWGILGDEEEDLVLVDDLLICATNTWSIDEDAVAVWGHSGGALWTSLLTMARPDVFSSATEWSGGSDVTLGLPGLQGPWVNYIGAPNIPYFLSTAGDADVWPDPSAAVLDFQASTSSLEDQLVADGITTARCEHNLGHYIVPTSQWEFSLDWMTLNRRGEASPYADGTLPLPSECALSGP